MGDLTIDELARETGLSVRNIRSHYTRGLLPPPEVRGRTGFYGDEHVERLKLIQELQADGMSLGLVEKLLLNRAEAATRLVALRHTVMLPLDTGDPLRLTAQELLDRFGEFDAHSLELAQRLGALIPHPDGTFSAPLPGLLDTAEEVMRHGISLTAALEVAVEVRRHCEEAAQSFVEMMMREVWAPFSEAGRPDAQWPQIASAIDAVRPMASQIFSQLLQPAIAVEIERAFGEELREQAEAG